MEFSVQFFRVVQIAFCVIALFISPTLLAQSKSTTQTLVASCCEKDEAKCTGSASCRACKNCKYCKYCTSGGTCGVCSNKSESTLTLPKIQSLKTRETYSSSTHSNGIYNLKNDPLSEYYLKTLMVNVDQLNLRKGPGTSYESIEKLSRYQELIFLAMTGDWVKVKVKSSQNIGFVHFKYIVLTTK